MEVKIAHLKNNINRQIEAGVESVMRYAIKNKSYENLTTKLKIGLTKRLNTVKTQLETQSQKRFSLTHSFVSKKNELYGKVVLSFLVVNGNRSIEQEIIDIVCIPEPHSEGDPIYGKNFWGKLILIGDDGENDGKIYIVKSKIKREVKKATKAGKFYTKKIELGENAVSLPTGKVMDEVINSFEDTSISGKENGGHSMYGDAKATRWDEGPAAIKFTDSMGRKGVKATINPFKINGKINIPKNASNVEHYWHIHPKIEMQELMLGSSNPSKADFDFQNLMEKRGYAGIPFVIGVRDNKVSYYNKDKVIIRIKYKEFKRIGKSNRLGNTNK